MSRETIKAFSGDDLLGALAGCLPYYEDELLSSSEAAVMVENIRALLAVLSTQEESK